MSKIGDQVRQSSQNAIMIIEWDNLSQYIVDQLLNLSNKVIILTKDREKSELIKESYRNSMNITVQYFDYDNYENMARLNIGETAMIFVNLKNDTEKLVYILNLKKHFPDLNFVVTLNNPHLTDTFKAAGVTYTLSKNEIVSKMVASYIFEPDVAEYAEDLLASAVNEDDYDIKEYKITGNNPYLNKKYIDTFFDLRKDFKSILLGISKVKNGKHNLIKNPNDDIMIELNDYLIVITNGKRARELQKAFEIEEGVFN